MTTYANAGDLGDVIFSLFAASIINDPKSIYHLVDRPFTKSWTPKRIEALRPLLESQPYIGGVIYGDPAKKATHCFIDWRAIGRPAMETLALTHAKWVGVDLPEYQPWLFAKPRKGFRDKVVIHRSPRYHNPHFPWAALVEHFGNRVVAIGLPDEHEQLEKTIGRRIPLILTENYLDCAEILSGCGLFIGNQSSPCAIALGLGIPTIQETSPRVADCVYTGANAWYAGQAYVIVDGKSIGDPHINLLDPMLVPPGGWRWCDKMTHSLGQLVRSTGISERELLMENTNRVRRDHPTFSRCRESDIEKLTRLANPIGGVKSDLTT
jgi:hypothetical protein